MNEAPTLDTGSLKSRWYYLWIAPFMIFSLTGFILVGLDVVREGFDEPWHNQAIGLIMLGGFSILLTWIFLRGLSRDQVWITDDALLIRRGWLVWKVDSSVRTAEIEAFELSATNDVFDICVRTADRNSLPMVSGHRSKDLESWRKVLSDVAPVQPRQPKTKTKPNKRMESNG